ncbi:MAG: hypothetical protein WAK55_06600 [Xanthobacteraceae bacterium]
MSDSEASENATPLVDPVLSPIENGRPIAAIAFSTKPPLLAGRKLLHLGLVLNQGD